MKSQGKHAEVVLLCGLGSVCIGGGQGVAVTVEVL